MAQSELAAAAEVAEKFPPRGDILLDFSRIKEEDVGDNERLVEVLRAANSSAEVRMDEIRSRFGMVDKKIDKLIRDHETTVSVLSDLRTKTALQEADIRRFERDLNGALSRFRHDRETDAKKVAEDIASTRTRVAEDIASTMKELRAAIDDRTQVWKTLALLAPGLLALAGVLWQLFK